MKMMALCMALAFAALCHPINAVPEFANHGTLAGWSVVPKPEAQGTVENVTDVVYRGKTALKMTQTYMNDTEYKGRYHSEVWYKNGYHRGETKFYGFAFRLAKDWQFDPPQSYNIAQWITNFTDVKPCPTCDKCDDWSPTSMVWVDGTSLFTRVKTGTLASGQPCDQNTREIELLDDLVGGKWYKVTFQITWKADETGQFRVWVDGKRVWDECEIATTLMDDGREFWFRVGLYANSW
jgi:hypothetical protein